MIFLFWFWFFISIFRWLDFHWYFDNCAESNLDVVWCLFWMVMMANDSYLIKKWWTKRGGNEGGCNSIWSNQLHKGRNFLENITLIRLPSPSAAPNSVPIYLICKIILISNYQSGSRPSILQNMVWIVGIAQWQ